MALATPEVETFGELVEALDRGDLQQASRLRHGLRRLGWTILPPARWGKGARP